MFTNTCTVPCSFFLGQDDILDLLSSSSSSGDSGSELSEHSDYEPATKHLNAASSSPPNNRKISAEKVKVKHIKGYNYGVPTSASVSMPKSRSSKSANRRSREERIKVCVRKRPMNRREKKVGENNIVVAESTTVLKVNEPKQAVDLRAYTLQVNIFLRFCFGHMKILPIPQTTGAEVNNCSRPPFPYSIC